MLELATKKTPLDSFFYDDLELGYGRRRGNNRSRAAYFLLSGTLHSGAALLAAFASARVA